MKSRAAVAGHPIHPMLVTLPIGLWIFSFISDVIYVGGGNTEWIKVAYYTMAGGIVGALIAAIPGLVDLIFVTRGHVRRMALAHMIINLALVLLFAVNLWMRTATPVPTPGLIWFSGLSVILLGVSGWLGGEMVYRHGMGVDESGLK